MLDETPHLQIGFGLNGTEAGLDGEAIPTGLTAFRSACLPVSEEFASPEVDR